jgi:hypothetical protein
MWLLNELPTLLLSLRLRAVWGGKYWGKAHTPLSSSEKLLKLDAKTREYDVVVIGEEPHVAYNRVGLTSFFQHRKVENLYLNPLDWVCPPLHPFKVNASTNTIPDM